MSEARRRHLATDEMPTAQPELQKQTLTLYGELVCSRVDWAGRLVFAAFNGASQTGFSAAASLAGAVALVVDADGASVHLASRDGAFDFVVKTFDEALRAVKNEIRRGRPLAVALLADPQNTAKQAVERGLAPDFTLTVAPDDEPARTVHSSGAVQLGFAGRPSESNALKDWLGARRWRPYEVPPLSSQSHLQSLTELLPEGDHLRRVWLRDLSKYQRSVRQGGRWIWLTQDEAEKVSPAESAFHP